MSLNEPVLVKMRNGRSLRGKMVAYDEHLNLMLSDAIETIETKEGGERKVSAIYN
jgi:U6 snRNA-associated Sm-like protein LSm3